MKADVRKSKNQLGLLVCLVIFPLMLFTAVDCKAADPSADYPSRPINYAVHSSPGGNSERFARMVSEIVKENNLLSQPLVVLNKPGAGGGVVMGFVFERKGNPHVIMNAGSIETFTTTTLTTNVPYDIKSFTPIVNMTIDGSVLVVRSDSPFKTIEDLIAEAKKRPKELIHGGSSFTSSRTLTGMLIQKVKGVQWNFISFKNEVEALLNVLSGNVHFAITAPGVAVEQVLAGKARVLLNIAPHRFPQFKDAPTQKEAGLGEPSVGHHGILGPPHMPGYAVKKLEATFKKVVESDRWKKYLEHELLQPGWIPTADYSKLMIEQIDKQKAILSELNLLKKK